jgi:hypothetical protein
MSTARCYTCHTLRPLAEFPYRRRDTGISASARVKRYVAVLLQRPGATREDRGGAGAVYRYRCVHPCVKSCPEVIEGPGRSGEELPLLRNGENREDVRAEWVGRSEEQLRQDDVQEIEVCEEERREEIEDAKEKLKRCVGAVERAAVSP